MNRPDYPAGVAYGLLAYVIWGCFPLFFRQLAQVAPMDILANRTAWAFVFVTLLLALRGRWPQVAAFATTPGHRLRLAVAALLLGANWLGFLWAVDRHQVVESSLGYFLTPLVNVLLGLVVLGERLNRREWLAIGLAVAAVANELLTLGALPWISLFLAASFGIYGLLRKQVPVDAVSGLWLETGVMLLVCLAWALWRGADGHAVFVPGDAWTATLFAVSGLLTALPLMAFAAATRRLDLAAVGMLMYINPTMQFLTAVWLFDEPLQPARLTSFALIWLGLLLFSGSLWDKSRNRG